MWESVVLSPSVAHILATLPQRRAISCDNIVSSLFRIAAQWSSCSCGSSFSRGTTSLGGCPQLISSARTTARCSSGGTAYTASGASGMKTVEFVEKLGRWQTEAATSGTTKTLEIAGELRPALDGVPQVRRHRCTQRHASPLPWMRRQTRSISSLRGVVAFLTLSAACEKLEQAVASAGPDESGTLRDTLKSGAANSAPGFKARLAAGVPWHLRKCGLPRLGK
ncbi:hypothetical protein HPB52_006983 [Rhipicephalus sanguineus]|uniref:Uncharacterized protein n=1 Tax=Rhipicephalus sanguineus TaxID=34632 RepID=A0A9D4T5A7_RHISA|nr:hypothetical protein HPB52_006983 [Rhipicephalus sanguineus]